MYTIHSCLTSSYVCTRFAVPEMIKAGGGSIVNISSGAGRRGLPYRIGYCSAKAGQVGMAYGLALELGPHGIRVNVVAPGAVEGDRIDRVIAGQAQGGGSRRGRGEGGGGRAVGGRWRWGGRPRGGDSGGPAFSRGSVSAKTVPGGVPAGTAGGRAG